MEPVTSNLLRDLLNRLGEAYPTPTTFYLLGGSALLLLGSPRQTLDIDYTTDLSQSQQMAAKADISPKEFQQSYKDLLQRLNI